LRRGLISLITAAGLFMVLGSTVSTALAGETPGQQAPSGRYIVTLDDSVANTGAVARAQTDALGGELGFVYRTALNGYSVKDLSPGDVKSLRADPRVESVSVDGKVHAFAQKVPTGISRAGALENASLDIDEIDDVRVNADVAVIDTGIDYTHPDLNVVARVNCVPVNEEEEEEAASCVENDGTDGIGHGTHVAGTIGAIDNGFGVVGVAPGARLWAVRVLNDNGIGYASWVLAGINWVTAHASSIEVANMSLGGEGRVPAIESALTASLNAGVVYTVAAGNKEANAESQYPANDPDVITVSALSDYDGKPGGASFGCYGDDDTLATFSNWGPVVDIAAPGACIYSTWKGGGYRYDSGTSMASPHVAGAAAILAAKSNPNTRSDVEAIRNTLVEGGSLDWVDTSNDSGQEPTLYAGEKTPTAVEVATAGYTAPNGEAAALYGSINPRGQALEYFFEYGPTASYGQKAPLNPGKLSTGAKYQSVVQVIEGLQPEHVYHYRLAAATASGTMYGADHTFKPSYWSAQAPNGKPAHQDSEWLNDVSCGAAGSCMAVGYYYNNDNLLSSYQLSGGQWTFRNVPVPTGTSIEGFTELDGVSCSAANACTAVGKIQIQGEIVVPFVERWNGTSWLVQSIPAPAGSPYARLQDVSCVSSTECVAVGYYKNASGVWVNLSALWKGGTWSLLNTPNVEGTTESELRGVSCTSSTFCMAVGRSEGPGQQLLTMIWNGSSWSLRKGARSSGALNGVSCTSSTFCMAVTAYPNAEIWNGESWSLQKWTAPTGGDSMYLNAVSCSTASFCRAVGAVNGENRRSSFAETWSAGTWKAQVGNRLAYAGSHDSSVSCVLSFGCAAVGAIHMGVESLQIETYSSVTTIGASNLGAAKATLNGLINPEGVATKYRFEYGPTTSYGSNIPASDTSIGSGSDPVEVSQELTDLPSEATYHYRVVAVSEKGTQYGADRVFRTAAPPPISGMAVTEPFNGTTSAVSNFATDWTALGWAGGSSPKGEDTATGWCSLVGYPTVAGAAYGSAITDTGSGIATVATMAGNPGSIGRYFSVWLDMPTPSGTKAGYEARFTLASAGKYELSLAKWVGGTQTVLASRSGVPLVNGNSVALVDKGSDVSVWTNTGSGFSQVASASDATFGAGYTGVEASGNNTRLSNFKAGSLLSPVANMNASLKELALVDAFNTDEDPLSKGGAWGALAWDTGANTGLVSKGWGPSKAYPDINGAYWTANAMPDTGAGVGATATLTVRPSSLGRYISLWIDMPNPSSARTGYELRFTETSANLFEATLSKWQAGTKTALASKGGASLPAGSQFAVVDKGATVSAWTKTGAEFTQLLSASDSAFKTGNVGVEGSGNNSRLTNFQAGPLPPF
jgi:subtilisin family serine protease